jgi:magnesium-transporting ATPase (P-type)
MLSLIMSLERALKNLILINIATFIFTAIGHFNESEEIKTVNENFSLNFDGSLSNGMAIVISVMSIIYIICTLFSWYLVYKIKPFGKKLYVVTFVFGLLFTLITSESAFGPITLLFYELHVASLGAILVFLFFTPIKNKFDKR